MTRVRAPFKIDVRPFMPEDWKEQIEAAVKSTAQYFETERTLSTLGYDESYTGAALSSSVRTELYSKIPWVKGLYEDLVPVLLGLMGYGGKEGDPRLREEDPILAIDGEHAVSANLLYPGSKKKGLEWHRDGGDVKLALILTLEPWNEETGGRIATWLNGGVQYHDYEPGFFWVLEASEIPHAVEELRGAKERICLMFNYTNPEQLNWRAEGETDSFYNTSGRAKAEAEV